MKHDASCQFDRLTGSNRCAVTLSQQIVQDAKEKIVNATTDQSVGALLVCVLNGTHIVDLYA